MAERLFTVDTDDFQLPQPIREGLAASPELRAASVAAVQQAIADGDIEVGSGGAGATLTPDPDHPGLYLIGA